MEWILCDERLPEEGQMVLTTIRGHDVIIPQEGETIKEAMERIWNEVCYVSVGFIGSDGWYGADGYPLIVHPIAWMPLPKPYRKTENCSGFPNNSTTEDCSTVPISSILEQVDEPQTCSVNGRPYTDCCNCEYFKCTADEPQTEETEMERLERIDNEIEDAWARIRELTDEPQDECAKEYEYLGLRELKEMRQTERSSEK